MATGIRGKRVAVELTFDENGYITETRAKRPRLDAANALTAWIGSYNDYNEVSGVVIPTRGQVGWESPTGLYTYWRGEIISLELTDL